MDNGRCIVSGNRPDVVFYYLFIPARPAMIIIDVRSPIQHKCANPSPEMLAVPATMEKIMYVYYVYPIAELIN